MPRYVLYRAELQHYSLTLLLPLLLLLLRLLPVNSGLACCVVLHLFGLCCTVYWLIRI